MTLLNLAGPAMQEQVGEILGRRTAAPASGATAEDDTLAEPLNGLGGGS